MKTLNAYYDLAVCPASYDFLSFLLTAERYRLDHDYDNISLYIVSGPNYGFRYDDLPPERIFVREKMLHSIVIGMTNLLPSIVSVTGPVNRDDLYALDDVFPTNYTAKKPVALYGHHLNVQAWKHGVFPLEAPTPIFEKGSYVTITLRELDYHPTRNSNRKAWIEAAQYLKDSGITVLFIPDTHSSPIEGFCVMYKATEDIMIRAQLYAHAKRNFFVNNGPAWLCTAMKDTPCTIFKIFADAAPCVSPEYYEKIGLSKGSQISRDKHDIVWQDDTIDNILDYMKDNCILTTTV